MIKNLLLLLGLSWVSFTYAAHPVVQESMADAESYKVEKPMEEKEAQRSVAGDKIKKRRTGANPKEVEVTDEQDSEVRYWKYQE